MQQETLKLSKNEKHKWNVLKRNKVELKTNMQVVENCGKQHATKKKIATRKSIAAVETRVVNKPCGLNGCY